MSVPDLTKDLNCYILRTARDEARYPIVLEPGYIRPKGFLARSGMAPAGRNCFKEATVATGTEGQSWLVL
ncbi:hypothetical protein PG994_002808 [Apiospora phragmitis]|uniref:Uncharacterized protein n=1 Tax=Apiospora phragmitis TaxID=2905665 RepID=A0ABR1W682_9PEZI